MARPKSAAHRGYYFALPRLCALAIGGDATRTENNWIEAYFGGVAVYVITYATVLAHFRVTALGALVLLFVVWIAWVLLLYLNWVVICVLRGAGIFRAVRNPRAQNVIIGIETTACAVALATQTRAQMLGRAWLLLVAANLAAAVVLRLVNRRDA
jgi:hypothetical protein